MWITNEQSVPTGAGSALLRKPCNLRYHLADSDNRVLTIGVVSNSESPSMTRLHSCCVRYRKKADLFLPASTSDQWAQGFPNNLDGYRTGLTRDTKFHSNKAPRGSTGRKTHFKKKNNKLDCTWRLSFWNNSYYLYVACISVFEYFIFADMCAFIIF